MGQVKEAMDTLTEGVGLAKTIALKAAKRPWSRVTLMAAVGVLVMGSYCFYLTLLVGEFGKNTDDFFAEYLMQQQDTFDQRALDYIEICIDAQKNNDSNKDYYCQDATAFYKDAITDLPNNRVEENIRRAAYSAMKVELAAKLRASVMERAIKKRPKLNDTLKFLLSIQGLILFCTMGAIVMGGTAFYTYRLAPPER